jgi:PAS domain S-box-containing protein
MRPFILRAIEKLGKMDRESIRSLIQDISSENELLGMVLDSMTDGVIVTNKQHGILLLNKSSERLIPFVPGDLTEKCLWEAIADREISEFVRENFEAQETVFDRDFALENGGRAIISCSILPLVRNGTIQGSLMHIEDVTDKRGKEARLRRAENLAALTTLTAGVAHEIKNPLASISIHIQLMQKEMADQEVLETKKFIKYLDIVNEELERLNMIVMDFLFAVRPMDTKLASQDINQVVRDLADFLKYELQEAGINLRLDLGVLPKIMLDEKYIKQALLNLFKNALAAMPDGGTLTVRSCMEGNEVLLDIQDSGVGIPEDNMAKIFEPYFTTKDFSTGLGLTLVYKIIKEHRGEIVVESREGVGTTFSVSLPIPEGEKKLLGFQGRRN